MKNAVLVTGATGGIGRALCHEFASHGHDIVLTATNEEKLKSLVGELEKTYNIKTYYIVKDLSKQEGAKEVFDEMKQQKIGITYRTVKSNTIRIFTGLLPYNRNTSRRLYSLTQNIR